MGTTQQIKKEAAAASCQGQGLTVGGVHPPVEPVPDVDWVGETWGLYWPDVEGEIEEKKEDPDKSAEGAHPPATETAVFIEAPSVLQCAKEPTPPPVPKEATTPPVPKEATPPPVKLRP